MSRSALHGHPRVGDAPLCYSGSQMTYLGGNRAEVYERLPSAPARFTERGIEVAHVTCTAGSVHPALLARLGGTPGSTIRGGGPRQVDEGLLGGRLRVTGVDPASVSVCRSQRHGGNLAHESLWSSRTAVAAPTDQATSTLSR